MFASLKERAQAELDQLKTSVSSDASQSSAAIESAFELGAQHHFITALEADEGPFFDKVKKVFAFIKQHA